MLVGLRGCGAGTRLQSWLRSRQTVRGDLRWHRRPRPIVPSRHMHQEARSCCSCPNACRPNLAGSFFPLIMLGSVKRNPLSR